MAAPVSSASPAAAEVVSSPHILAMSSIARISPARPLRIRACPKIRSTLDAPALLPADSRNASTVSRIARRFFEFSPLAFPPIAAISRARSVPFSSGRKFFSFAMAYKKKRGGISHPAVNKKTLIAYSLLVSYIGSEFVGCLLDTRRKVTLSALKSERNHTAVCVVTRE